MRKHEIVENALLMVLITGAVLLIAFRPIPSVTLPNDTGRYVSEFNWQCSQPLFDASNLKMNKVLFYGILRPACWVGGERMFILLMTIATPVAFLISGYWKKSGLIWVLAAVTSVHGFELETNALRQNMALVIFLLALKYAFDRKMLLSLVIGGGSALVHSTSIAYIPALILVGRFGYKKPSNPSELVLFYVLPTMVISIILAFIGIALSGQLAQYQAFYKESQSPAFVAFVTLPILFIYLVRFKYATPRVTVNETITFIYSMALLGFAQVFYPTTVYRFSFTSGMLQLYMAMSAENVDRKQGVYIFTGLFAQTLIYLTTSSSASKVLFG